ncbi:hypothetical protein I7I51_04146 [Histoplasma capsulatum]|uniref:Uncharacterized protein n=1 Tax=Ajellomyces capsulatus TaxID=5037 RepID=A0A8A1M7G8_AJECA|nr:hypothetical protein I7I51_04146 [Histoplasma capsulatum]
MVVVARGEEGLQAGQQVADGGGPSLPPAQQPLLHLYQLSRFTRGSSQLTQTITRLLRRPTRVSCMALLLPPSSPPPISKPRNT